MGRDIRLAEAFPVATLPQGISARRQRVRQPFAFRRLPTNSKIFDDRLVPRLRRREDFVRRADRGQQLDKVGAFPRLPFARHRAEVDQQRTHVRDAQECYRLVDVRRRRGRVRLQCLAGVPPNIRECAVCLETRAPGAEIRLSLFEAVERGFDRLDFPARVAGTGAPRRTACATGALHSVARPRRP